MIDETLKQKVFDMVEGKEASWFDNRIYKLHIPGKGWRALHLKVEDEDENRVAGTCKVVYPSNSKFQDERYWSYSKESGVVRLFRTANLDGGIQAAVKPDKISYEWTGKTPDGKPARFKMHHAEFLAMRMNEIGPGKGNKHIYGAELGVHQGFMSRVLLDRIPNLQLHMIDLWGVHPENSAFVKSKDLRSKHGWKDYNENLLLARRRVRKYQWNAHIHITSTHLAADLFEDEALDFVFIDGDHSFEGCYRDLSDWYDKVRMGGIFSGHDYNYHPGGMDIQVTQAVDKFMQELELEFHEGPSCVWWMVKPWTSFGEHIKTQEKDDERDAGSSSSSG